MLPQKHCLSCAGNVIAKCRLTENTKLRQAGASSHNSDNNVDSNTEEFQTL